MNMGSDEKPIINLTVYQSSISSFHYSIIQWSPKSTQLGYNTVLLWNESNLLNIKS